MIISLSRINKRYPGGYEALSDVSFGIEAGDMAFVTGHSGAGKTTLLKLLPGIERATSGTLLINGQNVARCGVAQSRICAAASASSFRTRSCCTTARFSRTCCFRLT